MSSVSIYLIYDYVLLPRVKIVKLAHLQDFHIEDLLTSIVFYL